MITAVPIHVCVHYCVYGCVQLHKAYSYFKSPFVHYYSYILHIFLLVQNELIILPNNFMLHDYINNELNTSCRD